ncbi:hypothetical protein [Streptomyces malaysiensis]|uniref:hypothetical protein n=1 Tax=Streptomyces malaysiensis TaxID=92644 RepID=UPI0008533731|nr:hypothetical protein [Streptomyces sp. SPMA113]MCC4317907.1 hypothetical protein [Streptomyces malaysiensis]
MAGRARAAEPQIDTAPRPFGAPPNRSRLPPIRLGASRNQFRDHFRDHFWDHFWEPAAQAEAIDRGSAEALFPRLAR